MLRKEYTIHDYQINTHGSCIEAKNGRDQVDERRCASMLKLTASGTLYMGIWSFLKAFMSVFGDMKAEMKEGSIPYAIAVIGVAAVFAVIFVIGISFRYLVWRGAHKEAETGQIRNGYVLCAVFLIAYGVYAIGSFICSIIGNGADGSDITKVIFDITSFAILCELLFSVFKLRKVRRGIAASGSGRDPGPYNDNGEMF